MAGARQGPAIRLRPARLGELAALGELCLRAKAVWGYDAAFLEACRAELAFAPADLDTTSLRVAALPGRPLGVVQLVVAGDEAELLKLFVEPEWIGRGIGRRLFAWAERRARTSGARRLVVESDPGAVPFYRRQGARHAGEVPSLSIPGRMLPRLELDL